MQLRNRKVNSPEKKEVKEVKEVKKFEIKSNIFLMIIKNLLKDAPYNKERIKENISMALIKNGELTNWMESTVLVKEIYEYIIEVEKNYNELFYRDFDTVIIAIVDQLTDIEINEFNEGRDFNERIPWISEIKPKIINIFEKNKLITKRNELEKELESLRNNE